MCRPWARRPWGCIDLSPISFLLSPDKYQEESVAVDLDDQIRQYEDLRDRAGELRRHL